MADFQKEIFWICMKQKDMAQIVQNIPGQCFESTTISFPIDGLVAKVTTNDLTFALQLKSQFEESDVKTNKELVILTGISKYDLKASGIDASQIITPHVGFYDENEHCALATSKGYGLLKSLTVGFASALAQEQGYHPAHASFIELQGKGIMLTGTHKAGKTTSLMHLAKLLKENSPKVLTDDWVLANEQGNVFALENNISFSRSFCEEFPHLNLISLYEQNIVAGLKKVYIHPDKVFGAGTKIKKSRLDKIVLLEPVNRTNLIEYPDKESTVEKILEYTYHMPNCNPLTVQKHRDFWRTVLSNVSFLSFDTRHEMSLDKSYTELYNTLK